MTEKVGAKITSLHFKESVEDKPWKHPLQEAGFDVSRLAIATMEKLICAQSYAFLGTHGSSFTDDIIRLRQGMRLSSCVDDFICNLREDQ